MLPKLVIPAKAGIQSPDLNARPPLGSIARTTQIGLYLRATEQKKQPNLALCRWM
jgi:hypothetical protein